MLSRACFLPLKGLGVSDDEAAAYGNLKHQFGDLSGQHGTTTTHRGGTSRATAADGSAGAGNAQARAGGARAPDVMRAPSTTELVEEELAALKRKLGQQ